MECLHSVGEAVVVVPGSFLAVGYNLEKAAVGWSKAMGSEMDEQVRVEVEHGELMCSS